MSMKNVITSAIPICLLFMVLSCGKNTPLVEKRFVLIQAEDFAGSQGHIETGTDAGGEKNVKIPSGEGWLTYDVQIVTAGRYRCDIRVSNGGDTPGVLWLEDYHNNTDGRTYNITSDMTARPEEGNEQYQLLTKFGCPLDTGNHPMKLHFAGQDLKIDWIKFSLMKEHRLTPVTMTQNMQGGEWVMVWSDEFEGSGLPDTTKWTFDIGNWGWGNNEPQYYTEFRTENARQENGHLIIEARKNEMGYPWTSARLTTRGKISFLYGKIEFKARVPVGDGSWAAGWLLGDAYRDEISWPYCGEIDVMECVGREIDDETGNGINHASCHTRGYYFKQGNQISRVIEVEDMHNEFHTYSIEWDSLGIHAFVDGEKYYTYDKLNGEWEWPFNHPQNLIVNLAMGGGMGGVIDENLTSQKLILDYIRVYEKR